MKVKRSKKYFEEDNLKPHLYYVPAMRQWVCVALTRYGVGSTLEKAYARNQLPL